MLFTSNTIQFDCTLNARWLSVGTPHRKCYNSHILPDKKVIHRPSTCFTQFYFMF